MANALKTATQSLFPAHPAYQRKIGLVYILEAYISFPDPSLWCTSGEGVWVKGPGFSSEKKMKSLSVNYPL